MTVDPFGSCWAKGPLSYYANATLHCKWAKGRPPAAAVRLAITLAAELADPTADQFYNTKKTQYANHDIVSPNNLSRTFAFSNGEPSCFIERADICRGII